MEQNLLSTRAEHDLRRLGPGPELDRIEAGLRSPIESEPNLDVKPSTGSALWLRLRIIDRQILCRPGRGPDSRRPFIHRSELQQTLRALE